MRIDLRATRKPHSHIIRKHHGDYPLEASCPQKVVTRYCSFQIGIECGHALEGTRGTMPAVSPFRADDNVMTFSTTCVRSFLSAKLLGAQYCLGEMNRGVYANLPRNYKRFGVLFHSQNTFTITKRHIKNRSIHVQESCGGSKPA